MAHLSIAMQPPFIPIVVKPVEDGPVPVGDATEQTIVDGKPTTVPEETGPWEDMGFCGPHVGHYSKIYDGTCYDLNNHYSMPRTIFGVFVRSPVEATINALAFGVLLTMVIYSAVVDGAHSVDWWTAVFKLIHFFFHVGIHIFANFSDEDKLDANKKPRMICGIIFGISRYVVLFIYAWRMGGPYHAWFWGQLVLFAALEKARFFGELIKTTYCALAISYAMLSADTCSWAAYVVVLGLLIQLAGSGTFFVTGLANGWYAKWWLREDDRVPVPYHVLSDIGNTLILICAAYTPGHPAGSMDTLLWKSGSGPFPQCGMGGLHAWIA